MTVKRGLDETAALRSITDEAAKIAGIDGRAGSSESGKDADLANWSHQFDIFSMLLSSPHLLWLRLAGPHFPVCGRHRPFIKLSSCALVGIPP